MIQNPNTWDDLQRIPLDDNVNYFYTHDLGCSAALIACGYELTSLDKANPRKAMFIFNRSRGIDEVAGDYWADRLKINARSYFDTIKMVKNRLYSD
jgi:hypothetical protein